MKHKLLTFALMGAMFSTMLFSCKNAEEPIPSPGDNNSGEMVEYSISVNIPEEMRTRAAAEATIGESGLYEFENREINRLMYAIYYDGQLKLQNQITRDDENPFSITYRMTGSSDPSKLFFFFWASNSDDSTSAYKWDAKNGTISIVPNIYFNSENFTVLDCFGGYFQFSSDPNTKNRNVSFTLKRPLAEIQILSDDFTDTDLEEDYPNGFMTMVGFGNDSKSLRNIDTWDYINDTYSSIGQFSSTAPYLKNDLKGTSPQRIKFKEREMDYYACFYTFPVTDINLTLAISKTTSFSNPSIISIPLPEDGIKANYKYIIYNKARNDGGTGFLEGVYNYKVLVDNDYIWEGTAYENEVDKL